MNSSWPLVKFVDSPSITATVRFDCNFDSPAEVRKVMAFDPGVPALTGDPDGVGQAFGLRSPSLTVLLKGSKSVAMAALSALSKEQLRPRNWVMYQPSALQQPVWFRTYRPGFQSLNLDRVAVNRVSGAAGAGIADAWELVVPLAAEPFAYGARVTLSDTITQAPSGTNPMRLVLPAIKGDAPTRLRVALQPSGAGSDNQVGWLIGCFADDGTMYDSVIDIGTGDGFTAGVNTGAGVPDAAYFGGSYRLVSIAPGDNAGFFGPGLNLAPRLTGALPVVPPGRYKVLLRAELDSPSPLSKSFTCGFTQYLSNSILYGPTTVVPVTALGTSATRQGWVDLGDFSFPAQSFVSADVATAALATNFGVRIGTADNSSATVRIDALKLLPVDGRKVQSATVLKAAYTSAPLSGGSTIGYFDGDDETYWSTNTTPALLSGVPELTGAFLVADPAAARNVLTVMAAQSGLTAGTAGATTLITSLNQACAVTVSYYPRYLYVGDGT